MNIYLIRRRPHYFVSDAYDFAIVAAETGDAARHTHPAKGVLWDNDTWTKGGKDYGFEIWAHPLHVSTRLLGVAVEGTRPGAVCTSFN